MATQVTPTGIQNNSSPIENITLATDGGVDIDAGHLVVAHGGNVTVDSPFQVNSTLNITGNTTLGGTLTVTGNVIFNGALLDLNTNLDLTGTLDVTGNSTFTGDVDITGDLTVDTDILFVNSSTNRVGIGTTSPAQALEVNGNIQVGDTQTSAARVDFGSASTRIQHDGADNLSVYTNGAEQARIDSSGKLLVGTPTARTIATQSTAIQNEGTSFDSTGFSTCRNSNDQFGPLIHFGKTRGTSVGSNTIVANNDDLGGLIWGGADGFNVDSQAAYLLCQVDGTPGANDMPGRLVFFTTPDGASSPLERMRIRSDGRILANPGGDGIYHGSVFSRLTANVNRGFVIVNTGVGGIGPLPCDASGNTVDNSEIFGFSTARWSVMYAATGTINTSDANEKQDIRNISSSELAAAQELKTMIKAFRWKDAVEEKGEDARIHFGVIAQEVQEMFGRHGLDATNYGFWCSDTFYELDGKPVYVDEDGNYPDGAVAKTRLGIRYSELLAFVIAAL